MSVPEQATGWRQIPDDEAADIVAEGVHTALRKGTDSPGATDLWQAIARTPGETWGEAIRWFVDSLDFMGMAICKKDTTGEDWS
jgi:hypothetical protein